MVFSRAFYDTVIIWFTTGPFFVKNKNEDRLSLIQNTDSNSDINENVWR